MRIVLLGYLLIGFLYMIFNAIKNWIVNEYYRKESFIFYLLAMALDVFLWPIIMFCDIYNE
jgi:hypothetical protein